MFYIYHHLGLGDHIICNGMVKYFANLYEQVSIFCHDHYKDNINYMYRDDKRINILPTKNEKEIDNFLNSSGIKYIKVGFNKLSEYENSNLTFDQAFYDIAKLDFSIRFSHFHILRDLEKEEQIYNKLNSRNEKYIYVHDDASRGFSINTNKHRNDLKIIKNDKSVNLFNMRMILEKAEEIHTMNTGMLDFINSIPIEKPKIYLHTYVRNYPEFVFSKGINRVERIN